MTSSILIGSLASLILVLGLMLLYRNLKVLDWRLQANRRWSFHAKMIFSFLKEDSEKWARNPSVFDRILYGVDYFSHIFEELPSYTDMVFNFRVWSYEQATGDYEARLEEHLTYLLSMAEHLNEDSNEIAERA